MSKRRSTISGNIGSVSSGTLKLEDLVPALFDVLDSQRPRPRTDRGFLSGLRKRMALKDYYQGGDATDDLASLCDRLNCYSPDYFYFGARRGDHSDYGFWLTDDWQDDFEGLQVSDLSEVPRSYTGEIAHINDHGNVTLYYKSRNGRLCQLWAIV